MLNKTYSKFLFSIIFLCLPIDCFSVYSKVDISGRFIVSGLPIVLSVRLTSGTYDIAICRGNSEGLQSEGLQNVASAASNILLNPQWRQLVHFSSEGGLLPHLPQSLSDNKEKKGLTRHIDDGEIIKWVAKNDLELEASISFIMKYHSERRKIEEEEKNKQDDEALRKKVFEYCNSAAGKAAFRNAIPLDCLPRRDPEYKLKKFSHISLISGTAYSDIPIFSNNYIHLLTKQHADLLEHLIWIYQNSINSSFNIHDLNLVLAQNQQNIHIELEEYDSQIIITIVISEHNRNLKITNTLNLNQKGEYELEKVMVDDSNHDSNHKTYTLEKKAL